MAENNLKNFGTPKYLWSTILLFVIGTFWNFFIPVSESRTALADIYKIFWIRRILQVLSFIYGYCLFVVPLIISLIIIFLEYKKKIKKDRLNNLFYDHVNIYSEMPDYEKPKLSWHKLAENMMYIGIYLTINIWILFFAISEILGHFNWTFVNGILYLYNLLWILLVLIFKLFTYDNWNSILPEG